MSVDPGVGFTSGKAIGTALVALFLAVAGIAVAAGLPLSKDLTDAIVTFITVATPIVVVVTGWLHHNHAKIVAARTLAAAGVTHARVP